MKLVAAYLLLAGHTARAARTLALVVAQGADVVEWGIHIALIAVSLALLLNRVVLISSGALGAVIALGSLAANPLSVNGLFCGSFLLLAGLPVPASGPGLLRLVVIAFHLAVGLVILLSSTGLPGFLPFDQIASEWPAARKSAGLATLGLAACLSVRRWWAAGIWGGLLLNASMLWFSGGDLSVFFSGATASYLVFARWPEYPLVVLYDGDCGFCNRTREWISRVDFDRLYDWRPFQSGAGERYGIPIEALREQVHLVAGSNVYKGFEAFRRMTLYNPATWFAIMPMVLAPGPGPLSLHMGLVAMLLALFSPLFRPLGEVAYRWVARNRHRLPPRTCGTD